jgi:hypothetical protein
MRRMKRLIYFAGLLPVGALALPTAATAAQCSDPWVTNVVRKYSGEPTGPNDPRCNIRNYNNGSWANFNQLDDAARRYFSGYNTYSGGGSANIMMGAVGSNRIRISTSALSGLQTIHLVGSMDRGYLYNGQAYRLISNDGSSVTLEKIVAQGGGNAVSSNAMLRMPASSFGSGASIGSRWKINGQTYQLISNDGSSVTLKIVSTNGNN